MKKASNSKVPQGTKANVSGAKLENRVEYMIKSQLGIKSKHASRTKETDNILLKNVKYTNVYGNTQCRSEFVCCYKSRKIRIECKTQHSAGSVDEKLPYLFMNFTTTIPESEAIIIIEGDGFKKGAKEWLKTNCKGTKVMVMDSTEFWQYLDDGLPKPKLSLRNNVVTALQGWLS